MQAVIEVMVHKLPVPVVIPFQIFINIVIKWIRFLTQGGIFQLKNITIVIISQQTAVHVASFISIIQTIVTQ